MFDMAANMSPSPLPTSGQRYKLFSSSTQGGDMLGIDGPNYHQWDDNTSETTNVCAYAFWAINVRIFPPIYVRCEPGQRQGFDR